ncbi:hypothetical protein [Aeromicrobium sp. Leaf291]|uniref:hypothetical protein n=1 Tax=Aeromicrobium sp. Leaf291 TaxID=1736325 RepID=UPI0006F31CFC|nr:hypothetical protein [Aeromicrobium sp. Leaf291]KQP81608.1 hypothetical protein ASF35_16385 [Aeromicrobium sp. Leaf291]
MTAPVLEVDRLLWEAGQVRPWRISLALDLAGLHGPEVDAMCGAVEPEVDRWEEGLQYPTWEQLCLLADATDQLVGFFLVDRDPPLVTGPTFLCGDGGCDVADPPAVVHLSYALDTVRATVGEF